MKTRFLLAALLAALSLSGCISLGMLNSFSSDVGYSLTKDVPYDSEHSLTLDVYRPDNVANAPVVVFFYGGRWTTGDKADYKFVGQALASRGFMAVIPNVRKYPAARFPTFVEDAAHAVQWAHDNAGRYNGDAGKLFVMGHDSGAHIAAMLALDGKYLQNVGGSRNWLQGMIGLAGPYDFMPITAPDLRDMFGPVDKFPYSQPVFFADGTNPPVLLMAGRDDETIPARNTESLAAAISKAGGHVEVVMYDKLSHEMILGSMASFLRGRADVLDQVEDFIKRTLKSPDTRGSQEIKATPLNETGSDLSSQPMIDYGTEKPEGVETPAPLIIETTHPDSNSGSAPNPPGQ